MTRPNDPHDWQSWAWDVVASGELAARDALVLLALVAYGNANGTAYPSTRTLAAMTGRSQKSVRKALEALRRGGVIDGRPKARKTTVWRFVLDPEERLSLAASADHLRTICGPSADPGSAEVEVEEEEPLLSLDVVEGRREREREKVVDLGKHLAGRLRMDRRDGAS